MKYRMLFIYILIFSICFIPVEVFAAVKETSVGYQFLMTIMRVCESFCLTLYEKLAISFRPLFFKICVITTAIYGIRIMYGNVNALNLLKFFITIMIASSFAFQIEIFEEWFYKPIMSVVYKLPPFVISVASNTKAHASSGDMLQNMLIDIESVTSDLRAVGEMIMSKKGIFSSTYMWLQGCVVTVIYIILYLLFMVVFAKGIVGCHIALTPAPIAICLLPFPKLRGFSFNVLRTFFAYALVPFVAAVVMGITLSSMSGLIREANILLERNPNEIPDSFFMQAILIGVFCIAVMKSVSHFSSQFTGGVADNFGQNTAIGVGLAAGTASALGKKAALPAAAYAVRKGLPLMRDTVKGVGRRYGEARDWMKSKRAGGSSPPVTNNTNTK